MMRIREAVDDDLDAILTLLAEDVRRATSRSWSATSTAAWWRPARSAGFGTSSTTAG
jgi:hypothetical protein